MPFRTRQTPHSNIFRNTSTGAVSHTTAGCSSYIADYTNGKTRPYSFVNHAVCTEGGDSYHTSTVVCRDLRVADSAAGYTGPIWQTAKSQCYVQLDFQENNSFELLTFLSDIDGNFAKFIRELATSFKSYGGITWGLMPFISDVKSLMASYDDAISGIQRSFDKISDKRLTRRGPLFVPYGNGYFKGTWTIQGRITEIGLPNSSDALLIILDELGLHPDLRTVWDTIPLSFAVDYLFPVGDALESLHPRGWFTPTFTLTGGLSIKGDLRLKQEAKAREHVYRLYRREAATLKVGTRPPVMPEWEFPKARELFNLAYLARQTKRS